MKAVGRILASACPSGGWAYLRLTVLVWVGLVAGCAASPDDKIHAAVQRLEQARLLERLEAFSDTADDLSTIRELFSNLDDIAAVCKGLRAGLDGETLNWILSKVGVVKVGWELLDSLEVMKQFWRSVDELRVAPRELRGAMQRAQKSPSADTMAALEASCASTRSALNKTARFLTMLKGWVRNADLAMGLAQVQLDAFASEYDSWGASIIVAGIKQLMNLYGPDFVKSAMKSIAEVEAQFKQDAQLLEEIERTLRVQK